MNQPAQAGVQGLNELYHMVAHGQNNALAVKRYEREARTLLARDGMAPAFAWLAIGAATFLQGKHSESVEALSNAVKLAPQDEPVLGNACSIFSIAGETELAVDAAHRLLGIVVTRDGKLGALRALEKALRFEEVLEMGEKVNLQFSDAYRESAASLLSIANAHGATPDLRAKLIDAAAEAVRSRGCIVRQSTLVQVDDQLRYELFIDETARRCAEMNFAIAQALYEKFDDPVPEFVTFSCRPLSSFQFNGDIIEVHR
ncbi:MAG TPA: hypothetical protein VG320_30690 [Paraburkholderia sp.]|uniref:hypothetical protein n=1 Tax=Paraburkholderia sp. TaxID=1926495 RepID=UPI002DF3BC8B|nr:hypothetical protein [Paraburkholderia sp.]